MNSTIMRSLILAGFGAVLVSSMVLAQNRPGTTRPDAKQLRRRRRGWSKSE